ncbi:MAG: RNA polymerase sigma factor [Bacteroides sp.]|nr:RNA polymerase sigma factor [Bacteroides sp.]
MEDSKIIEMYFDRSENAIRETETKYSAYLSAVSMNILNNREDCAECVNDTYLKAWNSIPPQLPPCLKYFLGKITRELSIDRLRKKRSAKRRGSEYELSLEELEECIPRGEDPAREAEVSLLAEVIGDYLRGCGGEKREVFVMRYYFCDSIADIARRLKMSDSKVKSMLFRTREGLRKHLEKEGFSV